MPSWLTPKGLHNHGNYIISLGELCQWIGERAIELGVDIFPGFPAQNYLLDKSGRVCGIATGDMGLDKLGNQKVLGHRVWISMQNKLYLQKVQGVT